MKARGKSMDDMQGAWGEGDREEGPCIRGMRTPSYTRTRHTRADQGGGKELLSLSYPVYSWLRSRLWREEVKD